MPVATLTFNDWISPCRGIFARTSDKLMRSEVIPFSSEPIMIPTEPLKLIS